MERFLKNPNLPENAVSEVMISDYKPEFKSELERMGIKVTVPKAIENIRGSERYHADMSVLHIGGNQFLYAAELNEQVTAEQPLLNICIFGNNVICNTKTVYKPALEMLKNRRIIHTNQRYAKCCCAVAGENAVITSDNGIYKICLANQIDVLKISVGDILLDGYAYGFIGGCCGLIAKDTLAFSGNVKLHKDFANMRDFARNHHIELYSLTNEKLYDIGGILPIKQKVGFFERGYGGKLFFAKKVFPQSYLLKFAEKCRIM